VPTEGGVRLLDLLQETAAAVVAALDADACAISRAVGDALIMVAETAPPGRTLQLGQGYLVSEFPETQRVLQERSHRCVCLAEPPVDPAEAALLEELGLATLLMLPLELRREPWGLVEVYREEPRPFTEGDAAAAADLLRSLLP
jgi:GAF domain-containing protein